MLIGQVRFTDTGIALYDVDGSKQVEIRALDALGLARWINKRQDELLLIVRLQDAKRIRQQKRSPSSEAFCQCVVFRVHCSHIDFCGCIDRVVGLVVSSITPSPGAPCKGAFLFVLYIHTSLCPDMWITC